MEEQLYAKLEELLKAVKEAKTGMPPMTPPAASKDHPAKMCDNKHDVMANDVPKDSFKIAKNGQWSLSNKK